LAQNGEMMKRIKWENSGRRLRSGRVAGSFAMSGVANDPEVLQTSQSLSLPDPTDGRPHRV